MVMVHSSCAVLWNDLLSTIVSETTLVVFVSARTIMTTSILSFLLVNIDFYHLECSKKFFI